MVAYLIAAAALLAVSVTSGTERPSAALHKKLMVKSKVRNLQNYNNANNNNNKWYNQANNANNANQANNYGQEEQEEDVPFEVANYALSYHRCAAVNQWDDETAATEDTDTSFVHKNFAILRFCPAETCDRGGGEMRMRKLQDDGDDEEAEDLNFESGARSSGCSSDYGEYMMELKTYLQTMAKYQSEQVEAFCYMCEQAFYENYKEAQDEYDNCVNDGCRHLTFEEYHEQYQRELNGVCNDPYSEVCSQDALTEAEEITQYFECTESDDGLYIGPHCHENGFTITLGVFADEYCTQYVGGETGLNMEEDVLARWYNSKYGVLTPLMEEEEDAEDALCIPCDEEQELDFLDGDWNTRRRLENGENEDNVNMLEAYEEYEMSTLCAAVSVTSAQCRKNYRGFQRSELSDAEWEEMQLSCTYIESIDNSNYDEMGSVNLKNQWDLNSENTPEWLRDNQYAQDHINAVTDVSPLQIALLVFAILACIILAVWSKSLHRSLTKRAPWSPGRRQQWGMKNPFRRAHPMEIDPTESGIGASRVRSEATTGSRYYMT